MRLKALYIATALVAGTSSAHACGPSSDCQVRTASGEERTYRAHIPPGGAPTGAILFAHGYRGSAQGVMKNKTLLRLADRLDVALIAVNADGRPDWVLPGAPRDPAYSGRREIDYVRAALDDASERFGFDRERVLATGFSAGGMLMWNLICDDGATVAAFAPIAGTFWNPVPESCNGAAADIIHFHGVKDRVVPMQGRAIRTTSQGDVREAVAMYAAFGGYGTSQEIAWDDLKCERRTNDAGRVLELCMFEGGHSFRVRDVERAWRRFEALGVL